MPVPATLDQRVRKRARGVCEYCLLPESAYDIAFHVDHIISDQHRGKATYTNLCVACPRCNLSKGPNIAGIDPDTRSLVPLFNPRKDRWDEHFRWRGARLLGLTPIGRATIHVLAMNNEMALKHRKQLMTEGVFPPTR